jgi:hypothetical protein
MLFEQDAVYVAPDGKRYLAQEDKRQYSQEKSWTFIPVMYPTRAISRNDMARDTLEEMLFFDHGRIVKIDFESAGIMVDTGWTAADFRPENQC